MKGLSTSRGCLQDEIRCRQIGCREILQHNGHLRSTAPAGVHPDDRVGAGLVCADLTFAVECLLPDEGKGQLFTNVS